MKKALKITLLCLIVLMIYLIINPKKTSVEKNYSNKDNAFLYLNSGDHFTETFISNVDDLNAIAIAFHFDESNSDDCNVRIKVLDGKKIIVNKKIYRHKIINNSSNIIYFNSISESLGKKLTLNVENTCDKSLAMNFYKTKKTEFTYNDEKMNRGLIFKIYGKGKTYTHIWYIIIALLVVTLMLVMVDNEGEKKHVKKSNK